MEIRKAIATMEDGSTVALDVERHGQGSWHPRGDGGRETMRVAATVVLGDGTVVKDRHGTLSR